MVIKKKVKYVEPPEYIPKSLRKEFKLGEYAEKPKKKKDEKKVPEKKTDEKKK
nr:MAG TPA: hypothetical protein [Caudoviricetes sp.]